MSHENTDDLIMRLARDYADRLAVARAKYSNNPMTAGNQAQREWMGDIVARGGTIIETNPRTGVDTGRGGLSKFDVLVNLGGVDLYLEVQAPAVDKGYKLPQAQGQLLSFAHVTAGSVRPARYYKIVGDSRTIYCWPSRRRAQVAVAAEDYGPQRTLHY